MIPQGELGSKDGETAVNWGERVGRNQCDDTSQALAGALTVLGDRGRRNLRLRRIAY